MIKKTIAALILSFLLAINLGAAPGVMANTFDFSDDEEEFEFDEDPGDTTPLSDEEAAIEDAELEELFPEEEGEAAEEEEKASTPIIPKPDFLPGPKEKTTADSAATQDYILNTTIPRAINIGIGLLTISAFIAIIVAAIVMLTAFGNEDKYNRAKENLKYTIYGLLLVILSYAIVSIVVSVALPSSDETSFNLIPNAYAVDVEKDINLLLPAENEFITDQGEGREVSLPSGDFLTEIVPAVIVNVFYLVGILIFIALTMAGVLLISGRGNEEMVTKAKRIVTYSAVAIVLIGLGYALVFGIATLNLEQDTAKELKDESFDLTPEREDE